MSRWVTIMWVNHCGTEPGNQRRVFYFLLCENSMVKVKDNFLVESQKFLCHDNINIKSSRLQIIPLKFFWPYWWINEVKYHSYRYWIWTKHKKNPSPRLPLLWAELANRRHENFCSRILRVASVYSHRIYKNLVEITVKDTPLVDTVWASLHG